MKLLLHICCAPCGIYVVNQCRGERPFAPTNPANQVTGFYFNPNIHPTQEYLKRRLAVEQHVKMLNNVMPAKAGIQQQVMDSRFPRFRGDRNDRMFEVVFPEYNPEEFFRKISYNETKPARCRICWKMRLEKTALHASENGFDSFSTTLLISPYQDHLVIKKIGEEAAKRVGVNFYYQDFRGGFRQSQNEAREHNIYRQNYCGCVFSKLERMEERVRV